MTLAGFPHSEIFGSKLVWQLPEAYRSLLRPSSVSCVKASFTCACVTFYDSLNLNFRLSSLIVQLTSYRYKPKAHSNNCSRYAIYISRKMSFVLFLLLRLMQHTVKGMPICRQQGNFLLSQIVKIRNSQIHTLILV